METLTFECGHCNKLMAVGVEYLGQQVRCPHCQQVVIAPAQPAPTSALPEAAREEDPLAANPSAESPFAVAKDAPWWADPARTATDPPPPPVPTPLPPDNPLSHLKDLQLEKPPTPTPITPSTPATFNAFEDAVDDSTPPGPAALTDTPPFGAEQPPAPTFQAPATLPPSPPDVTAPWGDGASAGAVVGQTGPAAATRPRRSQMGSVLFVSLVLMPLILYAVLATILAVLFYGQRGTGGGGGGTDPREFLPDVEGDHPGFKRPGKQTLNIPDERYTKPLPARLVVALGQTLTIGDLEVQPQRVEWAKVRMRLGHTDPEPTNDPALILHLKLRNVAHAISFYPLDRYFNREWAKDKGPKPLTGVEAGNLHYFGGPAQYAAKKPQTIAGANEDKELGPGESGEFFVCTNCYDPETEKLARYTGPLLWRVQLRRGLVRYRDKDLSATAVVGVTFSDKDVARAGAKP